jgi:hypothetical protein
MRTVVIQTRDAPPDLVRFTEVRCLFDYQNRWMGFFDDVVLREDAMEHPGQAWRIRAGQYITSTIRRRDQHLLEHDLRLSRETIDYDLDFSFRRRMPQYQGCKQQYIFENYMSMVLRSRRRMLYLANTDPDPTPTPHPGVECWLPASGTMAYHTWAAAPQMRPVIYDINPDQLEFARWLNAEPEYPTERRMMAWIGTRFPRAAIAAPWRPLARQEQWSQWCRVAKRYELRDILAQDLEAPTAMTNIGEYLPCYHRWGHAHIRQWHHRNRSLIM